MTYATGAAACHKLGLHRMVKTEPGITTCTRCDHVEFIAYTEDEVFMFDGRDAHQDFCRAGYESADGMSESEWDARRGSEL